MNISRYIGIYILVLYVPVGRVLAQSYDRLSNEDPQERMYTPEESSRSLLSRLYGTMDFLRLGKRFGGYTCTIPPIIKSKDLSVITLNGMIYSMTTVLVGYGRNETSDTFRGNKGYIYGVGIKRDFSPRSKHKFSFTVDYAPPVNTKWPSEEFCILVFSPALTIGPSIISTLGKRYNDRRRYFGSTENIVSTLIRESPKTKSRLVTQCCFIMTTAA